jgi:nicotinamide-nucleotide amidase
MKSKGTNYLLLIEQIASALLKRNWRLCVAESCTGGGLAYTLTELAGSSLWFERGFVTYSNRAKHELLAVTEKCLTEFGAVSEQTACQMASGALQNSDAHIAFSITGIAGPGGGSKLKPVGLVCFAWQLLNSDAEATTKIFKGDRKSVREAAIEFSLLKLIDLLAN